ncbi:13124_t:CDS:2 [Funneliformis caledonium]|uniref:13124_t:CDS:1 n=1 Tax=Funneliformis caledonium TaxID=1117310 RepID=A0A9N9CDG9_9GLOM|nr:13124_t:CDS:2 [Funneliformis caledonium]
MLVDNKTSLFSEALNLGLLIHLTIRLNLSNFKRKKAKLHRLSPLSRETRKINCGKNFTRNLHSNEEQLPNPAKLLWQTQESLSDHINELEITDSEDDDSSQNGSEWRKSFIETIMEIESNGGLIESDYPRNPFIVMSENSDKDDDLSCEASRSSQCDLLTRSRREQNPSIIRDSPNNPFLSPPAIGSGNKVNEYQFAQVFRGVRYPVPPTYYDHPYGEDDLIDNGTLRSFGKSIKPRCILPLLQAEAERSTSVIDFGDGEEMRYVNKPITVKNVTDVTNISDMNNEIEEESDDSSAPESDSQSTRITDYAKRAKRYRYYPYTKSTATNPRTTNNEMEN